jgi:hypothetical protein
MIYLCRCLRGHYGYLSYSDKTHYSFWFSYLCCLSPDAIIELQTNYIWKKRFDQCMLLSNSSLIVGLHYTETNLLSIEPMISDIIYQRGNQNHDRQCNGHQNHDRQCNGQRNHDRQCNGQKIKDFRANNYI